MKKSTISPKSIAQKRLAKSNIMKIKTSELILECKENVKPPTEFVSKFSLKTHDRETENFGRENPFDIPNRQRVFSKSKGLRKEKRAPFIMSEPFTICDIDSTFFKIIEGRPLRQFDDIKVYVTTIRDIALLKANTAYLKDQIIQVDRDIALEEEVFEKINQSFSKCKVNFTHFLKHNYNEAAAVQRAAKERARLLYKVTDEYEALCFQYVSLRNKLGVVIINFVTLSRYRQFLNTLSPATWKIDNNQIELDFNFDETGLFDDHINECKLKLDILEDVPLKLYFRRPKALLTIFDNISKLCLRYMGINVYMSNIINTVVNSRDILKAQVNAEVNEMEELVELYKHYIEFEEATERATIAKFDKILINDFKTSYASYDASKLFTCLQFTNSLVFRCPEDPKDSLTTLMLNLETNYFELTSALDNLNQKVVKKATNEFFAKDIKMMKNAQKAQRELKECDIMSKALYTAFEPSRRTKH